MKCHPKCWKKVSHTGAMLGESSPSTFTNKLLRSDGAIVSLCTVHIHHRLPLPLAVVPAAAAVSKFFVVCPARHPDKKWIAVLSRPSKQASCLWRYRWVWYKMLFNPETTRWPLGRPIPHAAHPSCRAIERIGCRGSPEGGRAEREQRGSAREKKRVSHSPPLPLFATTPAGKCGWG